MTIKQINSLPESKRSIAVFNGEVRFIDEKWRDQLTNFEFTQSSDWSDLSPGDCVSESDITNCFRVKLVDGRTFFF